MTRSRCARRVVLASVLVATGCASGVPHRIDTVEARLDRLLADYRGRDRPGACLLARHRGSVIYERCVGMADLETNEAATPQSNFRLASLTKQFTATAVLRLVQDDALRTTTTIRDVFPDFPSYGNAVTVHHLLTHTSGLIAYEDLMSEGENAQIKDAGVLALMGSVDSTYFSPGTAYRYSNSGYAVLAQMVEAVTGNSFSRFLAEVIFEPLEMEGTVAYEAAIGTVVHRAYGYSRHGDGSWRRTDQSPTSAVLGDGGIYSSLRDLNRWLDVVEGRRHVLDPQLSARMVERATLSTGERIDYGYGWRLDTLGGRVRYHHEGSTIGFRNGIQRFPHEDLSVVFLSNRNEVKDTLYEAIAEALLDRIEHRP